MGWVDAQIVLVSLAAMLSPTTLTFSVLVLVLGERPLRTGGLFYLGAVVATLAVGIVAAFVLGDAAATTKSTPKTWVAILDVVFGALLLAYVIKTRNRPLRQEKVDGMVAQMSRVASSPWVAIVGAGATLANPGAFIPIALKAISETNPSAGQYILLWVMFTFLSVLPLAIAIVLLLVRRRWAEQLLARVRGWLIAHARTVASVIVALLALAMLRHGIAGLT
jgi:hypothetical protein